MAGQKIESGATSKTVAENLTRLRESLGLNYTDVSRRLDEVGHTGISPLAVRRMEETKRRVDADDLVALAIALNVNPNALLMPNYSDNADMSDNVTAMPEGTTGADIWAWADGWQALPHHRASAPEVNENAKGMERGRQLYAQDKVTMGMDFLDRIRPQDEAHESRNFLAAVRQKVSELEPDEWLALWLHSENDDKAYELREYPAFTFEGPAAVEIERHIKTRLAGMLREPNNAHYLASVLKELESDGGD
ncbi:transcriptional regulator with XRE-family HTH domain [Arthrobacter sp. JUb119]|nr:transcriptional regulator with XRE-family HTH domain [Arthrobacter sp. JUb119]